MEIRIPTRDEFIQIIDNILIPSFPASERPEARGSWQCSMTESSSH